MKKLLLLSLMLLIMSWNLNAQIATKPALGDGTGTNPYQIASLENLYWISANPNEWGKCFIQTQDIDASQTSGWFGGTGWVPIGTGPAPFLGFYNGQGHTINNLFINRPSTYQGFFGLAGNAFWSRWARIENLGVTNVNFSGGVCTGGLVGYNDCGYLTNCYSTGVVNGTFYHFGGLVGISGSKSSITNCYSKANVTGKAHCRVGGLVGYLGAGSEISNSYSRGSVTSTEEDPDLPSPTGGLVGEIKENGLIKNCYSTGLVSGGLIVGGLAGYGDGNQIVTNSFWDKTTSNQALSPGGGTGKTTTEMNTQSTFSDVGWDFTTIWEMNSANNNGYPDFVLESNCTDGTIVLISGYDNQTVCANTNITPVVYQVGGKATSAFISPALPTGMSGYYNAANGTFTISGKSSIAGVYTYSVITFGTASPCNEATATGTITIQPLLTPSVMIQSNDVDNIICEGTNLTFTATPANTGGGTVSYNWKLNGSTVGTDQNIYNTTTLVDGDRVSCDISITGGECMAATTANSNVIIATVNPMLTPSVEITSTDADNIICAGTWVTLTAKPNNTGGGNVAYQWYYFNKIANTLYYEGLDGQTFQTSLFGDGDYVYCEITVTGGTCLTTPTATSEIITMEVNNPETRPTVTIESNPVGEICPGEDVTFTAIPENTGGGTVSYQWYFYCKRENKLYKYDAWIGNPRTINELEDGDEVYCEITVTDAACFSSAVALSNRIIISEIARPDAGDVYGENVIQVGESTTLNAEIPGGEWFWDENYVDISVLDNVVNVTGIGVGMTTIYYIREIPVTTPCNFDYGLTIFPITVSEPQKQCTGSAWAVFAFNDPDNNMVPQNATGNPDDNFATIGNMENVKLDLTGGCLTLGDHVNVNMRKSPDDWGPSVVIHQSQDGQSWSVASSFNVTSDDFTGYNVSVSENTRYISIENISSYWLFVESVTFNYPCPECIDGTLTLTSDNNLQSVCLSSAASNIAYIIGGGATGATVDGLPDGMGWNFVSETLTISGTPIESGTFNFTVTTTGIASPCVEATATGTITVNSLPVVSDIIPSTLDPIAVNVLLPITVSYSDVDNNVETAIIDWGDGSNNDFSLKVHSYSNAGVYTMTVSVDDGCGTVTKTYQYVVVYDPSAGFATGGGWIESPICTNVVPAYEYMDVSGKANFGFVAKYLKGKQTPDGSTEFQFKAGGLNFKSTNYDWLIISGSKAMYKGSGTINGSGDFGFMLSAVDAELTESTDVDLFRIKIWDKDNGDAVVYDNQCGADDDADPDQTTKIAGGSIVIHSSDKKSKSAEIANIVAPTVDQVSLTVYPNPFSEKLNFEFVSPEDGTVLIDIYDLTGRLIKTVFNGPVVKDVTYKPEFNPELMINEIFIYKMILGETVLTGKAIYNK